MPIIQRPIILDDKQESDFINHVDSCLSTAVEVHSAFENRLARFKRAYKTLPEVERKTFPWDGASNIVVPFVAVAVDAIVARMMAMVFGAKDFAEVQIKNPAWEPYEKPIRDWINSFIASSGARDRLREIFFDAAHDGDAFVEPRWVEESRIWHSYDPSGEIREMVVPTYTGVKFYAIPADSVIIPMGYDHWHELPWFATRHRYTWDELLQFQKDEVFEDVSRLKPFKEERRDPRYRVVQEATKASGGIEPTYTIYQVRGRFPIPQTGTDEPVFEEVILAYSPDARVFVRKIYNPFFGKFRHLVKVPFLVQPHEIRGIGAAEQVLQFQDIASTAYNQAVDAATAANAGIVVTDPESSLAKDPEIHPGKVVITESPDKTKVLHLSENSTALERVVDFAGRLQQVRSGVSDYNLGLESTVVGSRATATGTTALIGQGNIRFNVSIDEMRSAIEELLYLTIQQEQQFRPEGTPLPNGTTIRWPQTDPRVGIGLTVRLTSDQINRESEIQSYQLLFNILNEYYARFMQAVALIMNPGFPPGMKLAAANVMNAAQNIVVRMVERFDIENVDVVVPNIIQAIQSIIALNSMAQQQGAYGPGGAPSGPQAMAGPPGLGPNLLPGAAPVGAPGIAPPNGGGGGPTGPAPPPGGGQIPY